MVATTAPAPAANPPAADVTYNPEWFDVLDRVEDRHFWFVARRRVVRALAAQACAGFADRPWLLEIGCGNGGLLSTLRDACPDARLIGTDLYLAGLRHARRRSGGRAHLLQSDLRTPPFGARFRLIGLFDVLEHIPDDRAVLRSVHGLLEPGGAVLLTVPAHAFLWSYFDEVSNHQRRYEPAGLRGVIEAAGLRVEYLSQFMAPLLPLMWLARRGKNVKAGTDAAGAAAANAERATRELKVVPLFNALMNAMLAAESKLVGRRARIPFGTSLVALARKDG